VRIGVIGTKGGWSSELLADAVGTRTGERILIDMESLVLDLPSGRMIAAGVEVSGLDGLIVKKIGARYSPDLLDRLELLRFLSERGMPILSDPLRILRVLDRLSCTITLQLASIPMPPTTITEDPAHALAAVEEYGEAIFKPLYTSKARGMSIIRRGGLATHKIAEFARENPIMYIQKTVDLGGSDLGIVFLGGEYLTTYSRRMHSGAWNTTTESGGKYEPFDPPAEIIALASRAQGLFGLDFTCVDVALTREGPYVFEVSAFGGFKGILEARGIDAAALYADYALRRISR
jgi:ATP-grasp enzyme of GAK system